jgi:hypothetical protein
MTPEDQMTRRLKLAADDVTPIHCSSEIFLLRYGFNWRDVHQRFLSENDLPCDELPAFSVPGTRNLLDEIHTGERRLDWCPGGVRLYDHLYPFFLSRNMNVWTKLSERVFETLVTDEGAWIVSANRNVCLDQTEHRRRVSQSGFFERVIQPSAVQLLYLIALAEYRGQSFIEKNMPYRSPDADHLVYVRTATRIELKKQVHAVFIAYLPGKAVCLWSAPLTHECDSLITPDIFLLHAEKSAEAANVG